MAVNLSRIENEQQMEVAISGPNRANRLFVYTGTAVFYFSGTSNNWDRDSLSFIIGREFSPGEVHSAIATASLASIYNHDPASPSGCAVDSVDAHWDDQSKKIEVTAQLAVRGTGSNLYRMGYQVTVLAKV